MADATPRREAHDDWGSWESRRRDQLASGLRVSPAERVAWLVTMIELAWKTGALPKRREDGPDKRVK